MRWGLFLWCLILSSAAGAAELKELRIWDGAESTRVVLELDQPAAYKWFKLDNPQRLVVDVAGLGAADARKINAASGSGPIQRIRGGVQKEGVRLVLDLRQNVFASAFAMSRDDGKGHQVVIELAAPQTAAGSAAQASPPARAPGVAAPPQTVKPAVPATVPAPAMQLRPKPIVIVVDAGHGGKDPGARGASGLLEKDVALSIARKLASLINGTPNMRAVLTRDSDKFLELRQRVDIARQHQADLFVSIHANAFTQRSMRGSAVYVLSDRGATSEHARWLAAKENEADLVGGVDLHQRDKELAAVLIDLSQGATMEASFDVGNRILGKLGRINPLQRRDIQQAGFMVLKAPDIPSVLVETAFITNPQEEKLLRSAQFQQRLAQQIHTGIKGYFESYRPQQQVVEAPARAQQVSRR